MKRFKKILVVYDGEIDNRVLFERAVELAQRNQAALMVVEVIEEAPCEPPKPGRPEPVNDAQGPVIHIIEAFPPLTSVQPVSESQMAGWKSAASTPEELPLDLQEDIIQEEQHNLEQCVAAIHQTGIHVSSKTLYGTPFLEIIQEVLRSQHDLVMITAEGSDGLDEMLFGNTSMHLMRKCPCPVWVIKPGQPRKFGRILAAVDLVQDDKERNTLNTKIIELATSLARLGQSELFFIHAWTMYGESMLKNGRTSLPKKQVDKMLRETQDAHRRWLIDLLQQHPLENLKHEAYLLKGKAENLIPELAQAKAIDLIVMGTICRAGIAGLLIGNTAEKVLRRVDCSILTVKPEGFITPVKLEPE